MTVLIDKNTKVIVQGITGRHGSFHARRMCSYGTDIVAGVTPGKGGLVFETDTPEGKKNIPVYNTVSEAVKNYGADYSVIFVPAEHARDAALEALASGLNIVVITEAIPVRDAIQISAAARSADRTFIGPNCPGIITPGECKIGIMPIEIFKKGATGVVSRSGTLTYEIVAELSRKGIGQSTVIGIGGDMINGLDMVECLEHFNNDAGTDSIALIGEIGGDAEEKAAQYLISSKCKKPVAAYIAGRTAPKGKKMGHAGAIISGNAGTYENKITELKKAGVMIADFPSEVAALLARM